MINYSFVSNLMENTQFIPTEKYIHHTPGIYLRIRQLFSCALNEVSPAFIISPPSHPSEPVASVFSIKKCQRSAKKPSAVIKCS